MGKLGTLDLEFLHLGIRNNGVFNENDIEKSDLKRLGVGRTLDALASLKERNLIKIDQGEFRVTDVAKKIFWDNQIPVYVKILRLLEIRAFPLEKISGYLNEEEEIIFGEIEIMRKKHLVMVSPLRTDNGLEKMYEILDAGISELEKINKNYFVKTDLTDEDSSQLIQEAIIQINDQITDENVRKSIVEKLRHIEGKLK